MPAPRRLLLALLAALVLLLPAAAGAAAPKLDPTFGRHGVAEPTYGPTYEGAQFVSAKVEADGSILAALEQNYEGATKALRYLPDGRVDPSFKRGSKEGALEVVDSAGRTLRVSEHYEGEALERLNPDGSPDTSFGSGETGGAWTSTGIHTPIKAILPLPSGKIVVAATATVARYDEDGALDPTFGKNGVVELREDDDIQVEQIVGLAAGTGESVLVAANDEKVESIYGRTFTGSQVVALDGSGHVDRGYGTGGVRRSPDSIGSVEGLPGGGLLLAGAHWGAHLDESDRESDLYLARLTPTGAPDASFGKAAGMTTVDFGGEAIGRALLLRPDGSIVVGGVSVAPRLGCPTTQNSFCDEVPVLAAFTPAGGTDDRFGTGGKVRLDRLAFGFGSWISFGVSILDELPGGGVLAAGGTWPTAFLAELGRDGGPERAFGDDGIVTSRLPRKSTAEAKAMTTAPDGRIYAIGETDAGNVSTSGAVFAFGPNGAVDRGFAAGQGYLSVPGNLLDIATDSRGNALVLTGDTSPNTVIKVAPKGALDRRFGVDGVAALPSPQSVEVKGHRRIVEFGVSSLAPLPGGGALVAGTFGGPGLGPRIELVRLTPRGRLDHSFGHDGMMRLALGHDGKCGAGAMAIGPGGRIYLAGFIRPSSRPRHEPVLIRLLPDGRPDPSYGHGGIAASGLPRESELGSLAVGPHGEAVAGGERRRHPIVTRFTPAGRVDQSFTRAAARGLRSWGHGTLQPGQVLIGPHQIVATEEKPPRAFFFSPDGRPERSLPVPGPSTFLDGAAIQRGKLVVATKTARRHAFTLRRLRLG